MPEPPSQSEPQPQGEPARERLELDARAERELAALRLGGACLLLLASAWLLTLPHPASRLFSAAGFAFALLWAVRATQARARARRNTDYYVELGPDALRVREGDRVQVVPWHEVRSVAVDEDRLVVSVTREQGPALDLEPRYSGLGAHELAQAVHKALQRARAAPKKPAEH